MKPKDTVKTEPVLIVVDSQGNLEQFSLASYNGKYFTIGRNKRENEIAIRDNIISGVHGYILNENGRFIYKDMKSRNGTYVETAGQRRFLYESDIFEELSEGAILRIGDLKKPEKVVLILFTYLEPGQTIKKHAVINETVTIGRASDCDIVLKHPSVSRNHCVIERTEGEVVIRDCNSRNGILVNGRRVKGSYTLSDKDVIQILGYQLIFCGRYLYYKKTARGIAVKGRNINKWVGNNKSPKQILQNVDIDIEGNEFVAVIGGSGAGKSTLMNVINGADRNFKGEILYDGLSFKENYQHLKSLVGYVPQDDIIYENLKLRKMLYYTALMRMPDDTDKKEITERIDSVLDSLDLKEHEDTYIKKLSGGQKKRASIAVELLADPKLFFLDEPTSGLDPGTEKDLMVTLRDMTRKQDRTVVIVTHTTQNLNLCDKIIFMGKGGRICFVGDVEEAKEFFRTDDIINAYNLVRKDTEKWAKKYTDYRKGHSIDNRENDKNEKSRFSAYHTSAARQYMIITKRYIELIFNDIKRLTALLLQPVLIGILLMIVADEELFDIYESTKSMMFVLCCSAIWIGVFDSIQEICKERNILRREHMAGLRLGVYILSKLTVQTVLGALQAVLLTVTFLILTDADEKGIFFDSFYFEMVIISWITIVASVSLGLVISAVVRTGDKAMAAAPFVLIVQLLFSGILFELKGAAEYISYITISRWSVEAMGSIVRLNDLPLRLQSEFPALTHEAEELFETSEKHLLTDWSVLIFMTAAFAVISFCVIRNVSKDER